MLSKKKVLINKEKIIEDVKELSEYNLEEYICDLTEQCKKREYIFKNARETFDISLGGIILGAMAAVSAGVISYAFMYNIIPRTVALITSGIVSGGLIAFDICKGTKNIVSSKEELNRSYESLSKKQQELEIIKNFYDNKEFEK